MFNPTKRNPVCFGETPDTKKYTTLYEFSVGQDGDAEFDDPDLNEKVETFIRFVYDSFPEDYTFKLYYHLMKALKVDEVQLAERFIERLTMDRQLNGLNNTHQARLFAIYQNNTIRFWTQLIRTKQDYVVDLDASRIRTQVYTAMPSHNEQRFNYQLEFEGRFETLMNRMIFYSGEGMDGFDHFVTYVKQVYQSLNAMLTQHAEDKQLEMPSNEFRIDIPTIRECFSEGILKMINQTDPEVLKPDRVITAQSLRLELRINLYEQTKLVVTGEITGLTYFLIDQQFEDRKHEVLWSLQTRMPGKMVSMLGIPDTHLLSSSDKNEEEQ